MPMKRTLLWILLVLAVLVACFYVTKERAAAPPHPDDLAATPSAPGRERTFSWRFEYREQNGELPPRTRVALITNGEVYDLGDFAGNCTQLQADRRLEGEVTAVLCRWAGHGDEIGVFKEVRGGEDRYVAKLGFQDKPTDTANGQRGAFREFFVLD